ncbi:MAG: formyltransferase family protein [Treponemataceae bacterium]|nr:formyltransferase family protein [Treponemataceae bacterium]
MLNPEEKTEVQRKGIERPQPFISPSVREEQFLSHSVLPSTSPPTDVLFQTEKKILVLVSGNGSNLQALLDAEKIGNLAGARIALVISDRPGVYALERAQRAGKPALVEEPNRYLPKEKRRLELSNRILERAREFMVHYIVLAGFLSILRGPILEEYRGRIINIHPSLLPKYGGPGMYGYKVHEAVLTAGGAG